MIDYEIIHIEPYLGLAIRKTEWVDYIGTKIVKAKYPKVAARKAKQLGADFIKQTKQEGEYIAFFKAGR